MKKELHLGTLMSGAPFVLPLDLVTRTLAIIAMRGWGKTIGATVIAEEMCEAGLPWVAIDPVGVWWGLRCNPDGSPGGYPIVIVGGQHADLPLEKDKGARVADAILQENLCCVIDMSGESKTAVRHFVADFCDRLMELRPQVPRHIFIEEAPELCLPADTEALTLGGWKKYSELRVGDLAACFDPETEEYSYQPISRVIERDYEGPMVAFKGRGLDCLVTPEHRVVLRRFQHDPARYKYYEWTFCPAKSVPIQFQIPVGKAACGPGIPELTPKMLRIFGWVATDGYWHSRKRKYVSIEQANSTTKLDKKMADEMEEILVAEGASVTYRSPRTNVIIAKKYGAVNASGSRRFFFGPELSAVVTKWFGEDLHRIPRVILEVASRPQLEALYQGLMEGDGTSHSGVWRAFIDGKPGLTDDFQELCMKLGVRSVSSDVEGGKRISVSNVLNHWVRRGEGVHYCGKVWDLTVPGGAFIVRRNGRVFVTGNCPQRPMGEQKRSLAAVDRLIRLGRNQGYGASLISQRYATIQKDVLTQCDSLLAGRMIGKNDRDASEEWIGEVASVLFSNRKADKFVDALAGLDSGHGWFLSPQWDQRFIEVQIRRRKTYHPGETRTVGQAPKQVQLSDVREFVERFGKVLRAAATEKVAHDHRTIPGVRAALHTAQASNAELFDQTAMLRAQVAELSQKLGQANAIIAKLKKQLEPQYRSLQALFGDLEQASANGSHADRGVWEPWIQKLGGRCGRMIEALLERGQLTRNQLATLTEQSPNGGSYANNLSRLNSNGLLEKDGDKFRLRSL